MHTHLPDQEKTILPYATRAQAHADYVLDREKEYGCEWWQLDSLQDYQVLTLERTEAEYAARAARYRRKQRSQQEEYKDADDEKQMEPHEAEEQAIMEANIEVILEQHSRQRPNNEGCRYGNKLLGPKEGGHPEHPKICHRQWFLDVWKAKGSPCKHVQVRAWLPFAKCDDCIELRKLTLATKDREEQRRILTRLTGHLCFVRRERTAYALKRELAMSAPYRYMSIIIDGADQSAHDIPHSASRSHVSQACWKLKLHLLGVLVHGVGTFAYTCPAHLAQGHNVTIQALFDTLVLLKKKRNGAPFPPVLYLQLDNTTKQCKGKYLSAFMAMLVHFGVFKKVVIGFLPVGHTHEDIDQFFSRIATQMRLNDAFCRLEFARCIQASFSKYGLRPVVRHWANVANISGWLESRLVEMKDITAFHQFRFQRSGEDGHVWMQGRRWPGGGHDDHWGGLHGNHTHQQVFKDNVVPSLLDEYDQVPPASRANEIPSAATLGKVRAGLDTLFAYLKVPLDQQADCNKVYTLYATPECENIPFEWDKEDIKLLLDDAVALANKPAPAHKEPTAADGTRVASGKFYLMRPADPDNPDKTQRDSHPINIVRVKHVLMPDDRGVDEDRAVLVQWWDLCAADQQTDKWVEGMWVPNEKHKPPVKPADCERY